MDSIVRSELAHVAGGETSSIKVTTPIGSYEQRQTDYAKCVGAMTTMTRAQYPDTRPWWNPFATDANVARRAEATMSNIGANCGPPPP